MRGRRFFALFIALTAAAAAAVDACTSFGAGTGATASADAGNDAAISNVTDGATDANATSITDADAGGDGGFCDDDAAIVCDDFEGPSLAARWNVRVDDASAILDPTQATSPTHSFRGTGAADQTAYLVKTVIGSFSHVTCDFDVWATVQTNEQLELFNLSFVTTDTTHDNYNLSVHTASGDQAYDLASEYYVSGGGAKKGVDKPIPPFPNTWTHVTVVFDAAATAGSPPPTMQVFYNQDQKATLNLTPPSNWSALTFSFGVSNAFTISANGGNNGWQVWDDSIICRAH